MRIIPLLVGLGVSLSANEQLLEIYTNKAFLKQRLEVGSGEVSIKVPVMANMESLFLKSACVVNSKEFGKPVPFDEKGAKEAQEKIDKLKKEIWQTKTQKNFYEQGLITAKDVEVLKANAKKLMDLVGGLYERQLKLDDELKEAQKSYNQKYAKVLKPLNLKLTCTAPDTLEVQVDVANLNPIWQNSFDAISSQDRINISQAILINNSLGYDLKLSSVRLLPFAYGQNIAPMPFYSQKVPSDNFMLLRSATSASNDGVSVENLTSKRIYEKANVTLANGQKTQITFNTQSPSAIFSIFVDGYANAQAYEMAKFKPLEKIEGANAVLVYDGLMVGNVYQAQMLSSKEASVYFGTNDFVHVEKKLLEDMATKEGEKSIIKKLWQYEVVNDSNKTQDIELVERLPVSVDAQYIIKRLGDKPANIFEDGKVVYKIKLNSGEKRVLEFGYTQTQPTQ